MARVFDPRALAGEDHYWQVIQDHDAKGPWTLADIDGETKSGRRVVHEYVRRLERAQIVERVGKCPPTPPSRIGAVLYRVRVRQLATPRVDRDGKVLQERAIDVLWRTMKIAKTFDAADLATLASTAEREIKADTAARYCRELARVGVLGASKSKPPVYRLIDNLGATAPSILRCHVVFDPNALVVLGEPTQAREVAA